MLAKIGVAIGNRLPSRKGNGQANSLGRFIKNEPPEIRLQRWFSNKTLAHEVGHAIQYAKGYTPMKLRSAVIPLTNIGSTLSYPLVLIGFIFNSALILFFNLFFC